jgi:hypothetical protein
VRERLGFLVEHLALPANTHHRCVANRSVGLLSGFDRWHGNLALGGQAVYVPFSSSRQFIYSPKPAEIPSQRREWKILEK